MATPPLPFFLAPVPVVTPSQLPRVTEAGGSGPRERTPAANRPDDSGEPERITIDDALLQLRLKTPEAQTPAVPPAGATPEALAPLAPLAIKPLPELPPLPTPVPQTLPAPAIATDFAVRAPATTSQPAPQPAATAARSSHAEEPVADRMPQQPIRSVSLEFSPDGAGDVRLRLSEKAGEVHISLHSSDASLGSRLHEGVHDLVGSLSRAGYEAEAWTPGQGHQNNQREPEQRRNRRPDRGEAGSDHFSEMFQPPIEEIS